jgi:hypothetical protein
LPRTCLKPCLHVEYLNRLAAEIHQIV